MSSSRSIAAARNRRAGGGEQAPAPTRSRPNTSIGSQAAFSQPPMNPSSMQQTAGRRSISQQQAQQQQQQQKPLSQVNKISISDAIGLITIRLGRVEQYLQEQGGLTVTTNTNTDPTMMDHMHLVDKEVLNQLTGRIHSLENKPTELNSGIVNSKFSFLEKEVKEIRELLKIHISKFDAFIHDTEQKFMDVDTAFSELEKNIQLTENQPFLTEDGQNIQFIIEENSTVNGQEKEEQEQEEEQEEDKEETNDEKGPTFSSVDLKNMIKQELANAQV
jgi:hypothetical protein